MMSGSVELGQVFVQTTSNRGFTPEEIAERAVNRLVRAEDVDGLKKILIKYLQEAQDSALMDARRVLMENGFSDAAKHLGD
jgi:hypothetical protein